MKTIAVIGANGQVGSEVALFLSLMSNVKVAPICRSEFGASFLQRCGLCCRIGDVANPEDAKKLLADVDLAVDFSSPRGLPSEVRGSIAAVLKGVASALPDRGTLVYASSINAFGMWDDPGPFRRYVFTRTAYGANKRYAERLAKKHARRRGLPVYLFRLGQVHGELQAVSCGLERNVDDRVASVPSSPSYTVFAFTIAEALANIAEGRERPGLYTVVSSPEWSWPELYEYYARRKGVAPRVRLVPPDASGTVAAIHRQVIDTAHRAVARLAGSIGAYGAWRWPALERKLAARYYQSRVRAEVASYTEPENRPFRVWWGRIPGRRLTSLSDSRRSMEPAARTLRMLIARAV